MQETWYMRFPERTRLSFRTALNVLKYSIKTRRVCSTLTIVLLLLLETSDIVDLVHGDLSRTESGFLLPGSFLTVALHARIASDCLHYVVEMGQNFGPKKIWIRLELAHSHTSASSSANCLGLKFPGLFLGSSASRIFFRPLTKHRVKGRPGPARVQVVAQLLAFRAFVFCAKT